MVSRLGDGATSPSNVEFDRVHTFDIRGGQTIGIEVSGSPPLLHTGGMTLWKMVGTVDQAEAIKTVLETHGCAVTRYCEEETSEQEALRRQRLGMGR